MSASGTKNRPPIARVALASSSTQSADTCGAEAHSWPEETSLVYSFETNYSSWKNVRASSHLTSNTNASKPPQGPEKKRGPFKIIKTEGKKKTAKQGKARDDRKRERGGRSNGALPNYEKAPLRE